MMISLLRRAAAGFLLALLCLAPHAVSAQSTAAQVVTGYLTSSGCPPGYSVCFVQYGAGGPVGPILVSPASVASTSVLGSNLVVKNAAGTLYSFDVQADPTLSGAPWWVMIFNATSLPANGTVTPAKCYALPSGSTGISAAFASGGATFGTGITIGVSTTGCFSLTASSHAFISGDFQ